MVSDFAGVWTQISQGRGALRMKWIAGNGVAPHCIIKIRLLLSSDSILTCSNTMDTSNQFWVVSLQQLTYVVIYPTNQTNVHSYAQASNFKFNLTDMEGKFDNYRPLPILSKVNLGGTISVTMGAKKIMRSNFFLVESWKLIIFEILEIEWVLKFLFKFSLEEKRKKKLFLKLFFSKKNLFLMIFLVPLPVTAPSNLALIPDPLAEEIHLLAKAFAIVRHGHFHSFSCDGHCTCNCTSTCGQILCGSLNIYFSHSGLGLLFKISTDKFNFA